MMTTLDLNKVLRPEQVLQDQAGAQKEARRLKLEQGQQREKESLQERQAKERERQQERQARERERQDLDSDTMGSAASLCAGCVHGFRHTTSSKWSGPGLEVRCCAPWLGANSLAVNGVQACNGFSEGPFKGMAIPTAAMPEVVKSLVEDDEVHIDEAGEVVKAMTEEAINDALDELEQESDEIEQAASDSEDKGGAVEETPEPNTSQSSEQEE